MKSKLIFFLGAILSLPISHAEELEGSKPNIVFILTDDQGYGDLGCHGHPFVKTPHIDQFYTESTRFTDYHVSPTCSPSRAGLMSGLSPFKVGVTHTIFDRERMALGVPTVADVLKKAGYATAIFGKWHLGDDTPYQPQSRGFERVFIHGGGGIGQGWDAPDNTYHDPIIRDNGTFVKTKGFCTDVFFQESMRWMKQQHEEEKPFFAYLSLNAPHGPFDAPESYKAMYDADKHPGFFGMITNIDDNFGRLMEKLKDWGMEDNTLVIFMTDNGSVKSSYYNAGMKGGKTSPNEGGSRTPFILRLPNKIKPGADIDNLTRHYDILPTFAALAGADISDLKLDGRNLLPLIENPDTEWQDRYMYFHRGRWGNPEAKQEKHRLYPSPEEGKYIKYAIRNEKWRLVGLSENQLALYDIDSDPGETTDVAKQNPEVVKEFTTAYEKWWAEVRPLMVNDLIEIDKTLFYREAYLKQEKESGIPDWVAPTNMNTQDKLITN